MRHLFATVRSLSQNRINLNPVASRLSYRISGINMNYQKVNDQFNIPILSPSLKDLKSIKLRLDNGLQALLFSDPQSPQSAAALSVETGYWNDHIDHQGTAHFLEHMLFLGTQKYPEENNYNRFVSDNGGLTNAYTSSDHTVYGFSVNHDGFEGALDRFAQFFISPLFNESCVQREMNAVDQEFRKNIESDLWREHHVMKEIADPQHPFSYFSTGHLDSMSKLKQETLKEWYKKYYKANAMRLAIFSKLPLPKLVDLVTNTFSSVQSGHFDKVNINKPIFPPSSKSKWYYVSPIKELRKLKLVWEIPEKFCLKESKTARLLSHVIGYEGKGSLLSQLKEEGLAEGLSSGESLQGGSNHLFEISITLTKNGLENRNEVIKRIFQAIESFKSGLPPYLLQELNYMSILKYKYQSRSGVFDAAMAHANEMRMEDLETYPKWQLISNPPNPEDISEFLKVLNPSTCFAVVVARPEESKVQPDRTEKWMGVQYSVKPFTTEEISSWTYINSHPNIYPPLQNELIPDHLELIPLDGVDCKPKILMNNEEGVVAYKRDDKHLVPEVVWTFHLLSPNIKPGNARSLVLSDLYFMAISRHLNELNYPSSYAGLEFGVGPTARGIAIKLQGYSQKVENILYQILQQMNTLKVKPEEFHTFIEFTSRRYRNASLSPPINQATEILSSILHQEYSSVEEKIKEIKTVTLEELMDFSKKVCQERYLEAFCIGNMREREALHAWEVIKQSIPGVPCSKEKVQESPVFDLGKDKPLFVEKSIGVLGNASLLAIQMDDFSVKTRTLMDLITSAIKEPFFSELRTEQQTGYIVWSGQMDMSKKCFLFFAVQSSTHDPRDLLSRYELFLEKFVRNLSTPEMKERFVSFKESLVTKLKIPPKNMREESAVYNYLCFQNDFDFDWKEKRIKAMEEITFEEFVASATNVLGRKNNQRLAILAKGKPTPNADNPYFEYDSASVDGLRKKLTSKL